MFPAPGVGGAKLVHRPPDELTVGPDRIETGTFAAGAEEAQLSRQRGAHSALEVGGAEAYLGNPAGATAAEGERLLEILAETAEATVLALP